MTGFVARWAKKTISHGGVCERVFFLQSRKKISHPEIFCEIVLRDGEFSVHHNPHNPSKNFFSHRAFFIERISLTFVMAEESADGFTEECFYSISLSIRQLVLLPASRAKCHTIFHQKTHIPSCHFEFFVLASPKNFVLFLEKKSLSTAPKSFFFFFSESQVFLWKRRGVLTCTISLHRLTVSSSEELCFFRVLARFPAAGIRNWYHLREEGSFGGLARLVSWTGSKTSLVPIRFLKLLYTETPFDTVDTFFFETFFSFFSSSLQPFFCHHFWCQRCHPLFSFSLLLSFSQKILLLSFLSFSQRKKKLSRNK